MSPISSENVQDEVIKVIDNELTFDQFLNIDDKEYLLDHGNVRHVNEGEILCQQHQVDNKLYIIIMGEVEVSEEREREQFVLAHLSTGELFGEISAMFNTPRVSTVRISKPSVVLELDGEIMQQLVLRNAALYDAIISRYRNRITETALRSVSVFRHLPRSTLSSLQDNASIVSVPVGSSIVQEGEPGDALYIIIHGTAKVSHADHNRKLNLAILQSGEYFGEWSLLTGAPRTATVSALTQVDMVRVDSASFLKFIQEHPEIRERIDAVAQNRHEQSDYLEHVHGAPTDVSKIFKNFNNVSIDKNVKSISH
ncbi:MAG: cyclic nucleotide-binding domain-containing protein [Thiohalomonadales bacterium]